MGDFGPEFEMAREMYDEDPAVRLSVRVTASDQEELGEQGMKDLVRVVKVFEHCLQIFVDRNKLRRSTWREFGWRDSLHHIRTKWSRIRAMYMRQDTLEEDLDDAFDMINYTAFFILNVLDENEYGVEDDNEE